METTHKLYATIAQGLYPDKYKPHPLSLELLDTPQWDELSNEVCIYHTRTDNDSIIKKIATERDLVNIENKQCYNNTSSEWMDNFGWNQSGYSDYYEQTGDLPPQIAIYCPTPVIGTTKTVHFMNSIGLGFDTKSQTDYKYFSERGFVGVDEHIANSFGMLFQCAENLKLDKVVISYFGGGWFSDKYPYDYLTNAYLPGLEIALKRAVKRPSEIGIMGNVESKIQTGILNILEKYNIQFKSLGYVPSILDSDDVLYQNAWDPHSLVGNGNKGDNSLDGFVGRNTLMQYLCWPKTNPNIQFRCYS